MQTLFTQTAFIFYAIGIVSMLMHAVKKWVNGEIRGNLIDWYRTHPQASVGAIMACLGGIATAIATGALTDYSAGVQVLAAWGIGFGADTLNSQGSNAEKSN